MYLLRGLFWVYHLFRWQCWLWCCVGSSSGMRTLGSSCLWRRCYWKMEIYTRIVNANENSAGEMLVSPIQGQCVFQQTSIWRAPTLFRLLWSFWSSCWTEMVSEVARSLPIMFYSLRGCDDLNLANRFWPQGSIPVSCHTDDSLALRQRKLQVACLLELWMWAKFVVPIRYICGRNQCISLAICSSEFARYISEATEWL